MFFIVRFAGLADFRAASFGFWDQVAFADDADRIRNFLLGQSLI
jgi:hypothetical protein